jgi:hypothetical protein
MPTRKVRLAKQYKNLFGNVFRRYETPDGREVEIRVRTRWPRPAPDITNAEARAIAIERLYPSGRR